MSGAVVWLAAHGADLLLGVSVVLAAAALAVALSRAPVHRQRLAQLGVASALAWLVLAAVPLPRWGSDGPPLAAVTPSAEREGRIVPAPALLAPPGAMPRTTSPAARPSGRPTPAAAASAPDVLRVDVEAWPRRIAAAWLAGAAVTALWLLLGAACLRRVLRRGRAPEPWLADLVGAVAGAVGAPRVCISADARVPFCCGGRRPVIVLPRKLCRPELEPMLRAVLQHELAHLHQRDGRGRALLALALPVLYAHPLYWWLRAQARFAAELVADDIAARRSDRHGYARALIELSERCARARPILFGAAPALRSRSEFFARMTMLLQRDAVLSTECSRLRRRAQAGAAAALVGVTAALWGVPALRAQEPAEAPALQPEAPREAPADADLRALRAERDRLRAELEDLRAQLRAAMARVTGSAATTAYTVRRGDTLDRIARRELGGPERVDELRRLNPGLDPRRMRPGQELRLPARGTDALDGAPASELDARGPEDPPVLVDALEDELASSRPPSAEAASAWTEHRVIDLVTLAIDLEGQGEIAEGELAQKAKLADAALTSKEEVRIAEIELQTIRRKHAVVRRMIAGETEASRIELEGLRRRAAEGPDVRSRIVRLEARLETLQAAR